jgi:FtsZ-interacting cell division protein ZipA
MTIISFTMIIVLIIIIVIIVIIIIHNYNSNNDIASYTNSARACQRTRAKRDARVRVCLVQRARISKARSRCATRGS